MMDSARQAHTLTHDEAAGLKPIFGDIPVKQHRIPDPPPITDEMTTNAIGTGAHGLVGRTVVTAYEVPDSDRRETLLLLDDGRVIQLSCDPGYADETYTTRTNEHWDCCMYDATDTPAGEAMHGLPAGHWL